LAFDTVPESDYYSYNITNNEGIKMHIKDYLSATMLSKKTSATLDAIEKGDTEKIIILKNNAPKAVLMSLELYQSMEEEIEDLRLTALAFARMQNFIPEEALSHQEMMKKFCK
jgi:antitoxin StbD